MNKEELEKEAEDKGVEYADKQKRTISVHVDSGYAWDQIEEAYERGALDFAEPREKRIEELKKENAELKNRNQELLESCEGATMMYEHLTKAKEIIKNLLSAYTTYADSFDDRDNQIVTEAEQFLSEVEK